MTQVVYQNLDVIDRFDDPTFTVTSDGIGRLYMPSRSAFQHLAPDSPPSGIVFLDGSFLTVKEIFRYGYEHEDDTEADIVRLEFSYHYQIPHRGFFFRCDHHPNIGDSTTHPRYHLHFGCWHQGDEKLPSLPRFPVPEMTLELVLNVIVRDFLNPQRTD